jgi:hypothetical protein
MYVNAKMITVETVPGIRGEGMVARSWGEEFKIYCKNLCKCYNVFTPSTTTKKMKKKKERRIKCLYSYKSEARN